MPDLAKRIKQARERANLTQKDIADIFGYKPQTVSGWERGPDNRTKPNRPDPQTLAKIAAITNVSLKWLITGVEEVVTGVTIPTADQVAGRVVPSVEWDKVRQFLGGESSIAEGSARSHFPCGPQSFRTFARDRANYPELQPGYSLIVDPDQGPAPGDYCLVVVEDNLILRRYRPRRDHVELVPHNPDFETLVIPREQVEIVGTVTEIVRPLRS